ncbi:ferredoxin [Paenarthrobacter ureafaciens]|uniref:NAD(P)/FAD-dependent oxidoreductase n=1 Tax=Paenarthrobacter ureafaciens TaxID=37931 RepID=UPI0015BC0DC1|nr:FAD-dependent oxidoreductase [Paenarthrobacter ureafaciens]NWL25616.1 ferredoxin [Paenarthrobacter ureafaciens]BCW86246.1 ferredoxin [Arthrobacter sp. NicSoilE8]
MTNSVSGTLIVGASQAGLQIASSLREFGDTDPIILVGNEDVAPYQRPPLSKAYLTGKATAESLSFRSPDWYAEKGIELRLSTHVQAIEFDGPSSGSGVALTGTGGKIPFRRLALAVGGSPRRLPIKGADLDGVCVLRDIAHAENLRLRLEAASNVVVIGGGFIGLEAAAAATAAGKDVTVVDVADRLLGRAVAPEVSAFYLAAHRRRGTKVLLSTGIEAIEGNEQNCVTGVRLGDGTVLPADVVLVGVGLVASTGLAAGLGLEVDRGIVVDALARTSNPNIVAAGDCTTLPHPLTGEGRYRIESVQNAIAQAQIAAATLMGRPQGPAAVPWFWSDQADLKLQIAGLSNGYDQVVVRGEPDQEQFSVLYYASGRLIAIDAINAPRDYMAVRKLLGTGGSIPAELAGDTTVPLKDLAAAVTV